MVFQGRISSFTCRISSSTLAPLINHTSSSTCQNISTVHATGCLLVEPMSRPAHTDLLYYFASVLILISTQVNGIVGSARRELCFLHINIMLPLLVAGPQPQLPQAQQATQQLPQDNNRGPQAVAARSQTALEPPQPPVPTQRRLLGLTSPHRARPCAPSLSSLHH